MVPARHRRAALLSLAAATLALLLLGAALTSSQASSAQRGGCPTHFSDFNPPPACWRPYTSASPFNRRLPLVPRQTPNSALLGRTMANQGKGGPIFHGGDAGSNDDYEHPVYFSAPDDPTYTVKCVKYGGRCEIAGRKVKVPRRAIAAGGSDGHLAVIDQRNHWEYDFWQVQDKPPRGGTLKISYGGRTPWGIKGADGLGSNATAGEFGLAAGVIRPEELTAGSINHALFMAVPCTSGKSVAPARHRSGRPCSAIGLPNSTAPAMGQHFFLDMTDLEINLLEVPEWQRTIVRALAHYGAFVGDTGGSGWVLKLWSGLPYKRAGSPDPWVGVGQSLRLPSYLAGDGSRRYIFDLRPAVDWESRLRVVSPCYAQRTC